MATSIYVKRARIPGFVAATLLAFGLVACTDEDMYESATKYRWLALDADNGMYAAEGVRLKCARWKNGCDPEPYSSCVCDRYVLAGLSTFSFSFASDAAVGVPLRTSTGSLEVRGVDGSAGEGELTLTRRDHGNSTYYVDLAGTFVARVDGRVLTRGVFFPLEDQ